MNFLIFQMKPYLRILTIITLCTILAGCGTPDGSTSRRQRVIQVPQAVEVQGGVASTPPVVVIITADDGNPRVPDAAFQTVAKLLLELSANSASPTALDNLSQGLRQQVGSSEGLVQLLGLQTSIPDFELLEVSLGEDGTTAEIEASLKYAQPVARRFSLVLEGSDWKISAVRALEGSGKVYPSGPEDVVQAFLVAYQDDPDGMSHYLSNARLAQMPEGGAAALLNIGGTLEGFVIQSASVSQNPPEAAVTAALQVDGAKVLRVFRLGQQDKAWFIEEINEAAQ
jgi:hypothetical protein